MPKLGQVPCYREKNEHRKFIYGIKLGLRRARRRLDKQVIQRELEQMG